jgi:hypothetical protein
MARELTSKENISAAKEKVSIRRNGCSTRGQREAKRDGHMCQVTTSVLYAEANITVKIKEKKMGSLLWKVFSVVS